MCLRPAGNGHVYRTGDKVKWLDNGELLYIGRIDRELKSGAQNRAG